MVEEPPSSGAVVEPGGGGDVGSSAIGSQEISGAAKMPIVLPGACSVSWAIVKSGAVREARDTMLVAGRLDAYGSGRKGTITCRGKFRVMLPEETLAAFRAPLSENNSAAE